MRNAFARFARTAALVATLAAGSAFASKPLTVLDGEAYAAQGPDQAMALKLYERGNVLREELTDDQGAMTQGTYIGGWDHMVESGDVLKDRYTYGALHLVEGKNGLEATIYCENLSSSDYTALVDSDFSNQVPEGLIAHNSVGDDIRSYFGPETFKEKCYRDLSRALDAETPKQTLTFPDPKTALPAERADLIVDGKFEGSQPDGPGPAAKLAVRLSEYASVWRDLTYDSSRRLIRGSFFEGGQNTYSTNHGRFSYAIYQVFPTPEGIDQNVLCATQTDDGHLFVLHHGGSTDANSYEAAVTIPPEGAPQVTEDRTQTSDAMALCAKYVRDTVNQTALSGIRGSARRAVGSFAAEIPPLNTTQ